MYAARFHLTAVANRELTDEEVAGLPSGWTRNPEQHHYVQIHGLGAASIGAACDRAETVLRRVSVATPTLAIRTVTARAASDPVPATPPGAHRRSSAT